MDRPWWLALYLTLGATLAILAYPPFLYGFGGINPNIQYGFVLSGPPAATAVRQMEEPGSPGTALVTYAVYLPGLLLELALVWGLYAALLGTVLRSRSSGKS